MYEEFHDINKTDWISTHYYPTEDNKKELFVVKEHITGLNNIYLIETVYTEIREVANAWAS